MCMFYTHHSEKQQEGWINFLAIELKDAKEDINEDIYILKVFCISELSVK